MITEAVQFLLEGQSPSGGWGYAEGQDGYIEPSSAVVMALSGLNSAREAVARGLTWLGSLQHADGGWGIEADDQESGWSTAWALLALMDGTENAEAVRRATSFLHETPVWQPPDDAMQKEAQAQLDMDFNLRGWSWLPHQASWVEPTALAILALHRAALDEFEGRLAEATEYLLDRRCRGGGWNFGNPVMLGAPLPPRAQPTAIALLALVQLDRASVEDRDLQALRQEMDRDGGALALSWGLLALRSLGEDDQRAAASLAKLQRSDGSWGGNPYQTAIALLADRGSLWAPA